MIKIQESYCPIHLAAYHGHSDILQSLVEEYGVDPNAKSSVR